MNRSTAWWMPLATLALSTAAHAADPGFYFAATGGRVEHDVEGWPGIPIAVATLSPGTPLSPGAPLDPVFGVVIPRPPGGPVFTPVPPFALLPNSVEIDEVDAGFSATVGYRINRYLAAELSYVDFGEYQVIQRYSFSNVRYELGVRGPSVSVLGSLPLNEQWELFLRGGVLFADQQVTLDITTSSGSSAPATDYEFSDEVIMAGAGVQWSFAPRWAARLEYQRTDDLKYDNTGESSIDQASVSVLFKL